jgi:hypothetical protein
MYIGHKVRVSFSFQTLFSPMNYWDAHRNACITVYNSRYFAVFLPKIGIARKLLAKASCIKLKSVQRLVVDTRLQTDGHNEYRSCTVGYFVSDVTESISTVW